MKSKERAIFRERELFSLESYCTTLLLYGYFCLRNLQYTQGTQKKVEKFDLNWLFFKKDNQNC